MCKNLKESVQLNPLADTRFRQSWSGKSNRGGGNSSFRGKKFGSKFGWKAGGTSNRVARFSGGFKKTKSD